jgi:hypothetical protein
VPVRPTIALAPPPAGPTSIRLREDTTHGHGGSGAGRADSRREPENVSAAESYEPVRMSSEGRAVPWKLIAAGVVLVVGTIGISQGFRSSSTAPIINTVKRATAPAPAAPPAAPPVPSNVGRLTITSEPAGARVLMDGKAAGDTPVTLESVTPGRHVVTLMGTGGTIKRTIKVEGGHSLSLDVPLFSGFAAISAPFVVDVAENGKPLGTNDDQIILWPGRHELRLSNKDLGYSVTQGVEITSGAVTRVALDPKGTANINAAPWAEVWIDGDKAGETPLANVAIALGSREIVFKNPQFPDRKITTTIKAGTPVTISVDFAKDR